MCELLSNATERKRRASVWRYVSVCVCVCVCVFQCVLGFPPGQRRDGGVGVAARVAALGVGGESRLFPLLLLLLAVRVVHRQSDERGRLPVEDVSEREIHDSVLFALESSESRQRAQHLVLTCLRSEWWVSCRSPSGRPGLSSSNTSPCTRAGGGSCRSWPSPVPAEPGRKTKTWTPVSALGELEDVSINCSQLNYRRLTTVFTCFSSLLL